MQFLDLNPFKRFLFIANSIEQIDVFVPFVLSLGYFWEDADFDYSVKRENIKWFFKLNLDITIEVINNKMILDIYRDDIYQTYKKLNLSIHDYREYE